MATPWHPALQTVSILLPGAPTSTVPSKSAGVATYHKSCHRKGETGSGDLGIQMLLCSSTEGLLRQASANLRSPHLLLARVSEVICFDPWTSVLISTSWGGCPSGKIDVEHGGRSKCSPGRSWIIRTGPPRLPRPPPRPAAGGGGRTGGGLLRGGLRAAERQQTPCLPEASLVRHLSRGSGAEPVASFFKILVTAGAGFLRQS